jgi:hypothetical protein
VGPSQVFGNGFEFVDDGHRGFPGSVRRSVEAVIDVIVNQCALCLTDSLFDSVKLLGQIEAGSMLVKHLDDATKVALGPLQPLDDFRMRFVNMIMCHETPNIPPGGILAMGTVVAPRAGLSVKAVESVIAPSSPTSETN